MKTCEINKNKVGYSRLTQILHKHADETITDEQVERVLRPVLAKIEAGEFSRPHDIFGVKGCGSTNPCYMK